MNRLLRVALIAAGGIVLLLLIVVVAGLTIVRSQWFHDKVRDRIVTEVEKSTGGRVDISRFDFDWRTLTAKVSGFTIHGSEPAAGPPLLHADDIVVGLKIISILKRDVDIALLRIDQPRAFLLVAADGSTNVPRPKIPSTSNKSAAETILDLAVGRLEVNNGSAEIHGASQPKKSQSYAARGDNLRALFTFDPATPRYHGDISIAPLALAYGDYKPLPASIRTTIAIEKNKLVLEKAEIDSGDSQLHVNGQIGNFSAPVVTAEYQARVSVGQAGSILKLKSKQSGWLEANGSASYKSATDYAISGLVKAYGVDYRAGGIDLRNLRGEAKIDGGPRTVSFDDVKAYALGGEITAKAVLQDFDRFKVNGELHHFDVRQAATLATRAKLPYDGVVSGPVFSEGRIDDLKRNRFILTARLTISPSGKGAPVHGLLDAKYNGEQDTIDLGKSFVALPNSRLDVSGILGRQLKIGFVSSNLNDILPALQTAAKPGETVPAIPVELTPQGQIAFNGTVTGKFASPVLAGHASGSNFIVRDQTIDALQADITASPSGVTVDNGALRQKKLTANFAGSAGLRDWKLENDLPVTATLGLQNAELTDLLALAGHGAAPVSGTLNLNAKAAGSAGNPRATADLTLVRGAVAGEPFDRLTAHLDAPNRTSQTLKAQLKAGSKEIDLDASYGHGADDLFPGKLTFNATSNAIAMNQVVLLHQREPDLLGTVKLNANGTVNVTRDAKGSPAIAITTVDGAVTASGLQVAGRQLGDLHLTANTVTSSAANGGSAPVVQVKLRSNLADANINADGQWTLAGDYPGSAKLQFSRVNLDTVRRLALSPEQAQTVRVGGSAEGTLDVSGPAAKPEQLRAALEIATLEVHPLPGTVGAPAGINLSVHNSEPIRVVLANDVVNVESAKIVAQDSTFSVSGTAALAQRRLEMKVVGNMNLALVHLFDSDIVSSGGVVADASIHGSFSSPLVDGSLQLKNANLAMLNVPNGLSNANGTIEFTGNQARVQNLTAESGGGKVTVGGFASLAGGSVAFRLRANASSVRVRYPAGVSTVADAQFTLVGTPQRSVLSGTVTVDRLAFNPKTDLGSVLSSASAPPETPSGQGGFSNNLQLDVQIQTAPDITFESSYTDSIEADANLRLRGSLANPVLLGRINISQGDLTFFGNKYTINQGSVSFFNPIKLEPILNIDLETVARGVDVSITVSGPITKLNVSYRSDPPLQFSDIVGLLATGRSPNDATIAARQPTTSQQSWQQMGASALVGQAIANPVAGRLQRFFGVSQLKIDPSISGVTGNPQAKVTLEQQITPDITFTYITDVANAQEQVIRVEWDLSPHWSAVALRDENGEFGVDFLYKKRFR